MSVPCTSCRACCADRSCLLGLGECPSRAERPLVHHSSPRPPTATHVALPHHLHALRSRGQPHQQVLLQVQAVVGGLEELVLQQLRCTTRAGCL